jgi:hypothetical protein
MVVSLHGDYRYDHLKNTAEEVKHQERDLEGALVRVSRDTPMIVCGYSGRDASIMAALSSAYSQKGAGALYWCIQDVGNISTVVSDLVLLARAHGHAAHVVPIQGFDDLMVRLAMHCVDEGGRSQATHIIETKSGGPDTPRKAFHIEAATPTAALKSNAFELGCPSEVLTFEPKNWPPNHVWRWVKDQTKGKDVVAVPFRGKVCAFGSVDTVTACFGANIKDRVQRTPISDADLRYEDGATISLMREALVKSMAAECGLGTDGRGELWFPQVARQELVEGVRYGVHESARIFIRQIDEKQFLILKPSIAVFTAGGEPADATTAKLVKQRVLGWQHNKEFNDATNLWRTALLKTDGLQKTYEYPRGCASAFRFVIRRSPVFAEISGSKGQPAIHIDPKHRALFRQKGTEIDEPKLLFSNKASSNSVRDVHPIRGILANRPFDYPLTVQGFGTELRLGVVCPMAETRILQSYLRQHSRQIQPSKHEADYVPAYPGFQSAFGINLTIAEPGETGWRICPEPSGPDDHVNTVEVGRSINREIEILQASFGPHVVLVFFPERWSRFRKYDTENESFNVHDFVKAASVLKGLGTQFLNQSTLADQLQCRVWWWLSLAFYVKAMRTPWVLDGLDRDTAFVGLGMSLKSGAERSKHVVMGCSHIYSSRGEGLQYRLSQVENPVFYGRNPFLSRDDARRVGEQIRELFFDSREKLPSRVVIHKRTRFTRDERQGLREGLSGVQQIEMLEIVVDDAYRYVASIADAHGNLREDNYPVRRGTVVLHDKSSALVWVHGVTSAISANRRYYQGKRRIPAPLVVRRHAGQSDLRVIAEEILGLSKMNWNTFDFYTKLPATVHSSNEIARIGSLLERFGARSYDYRLFI